MERNMYWWCCMVAGSVSSLPAALAKPEMLARLTCVEARHLKLHLTSAGNSSGFHMILQNWIIPTTVMDADACPFTNVCIFCRLHTSLIMAQVIISIASLVTGSSQLKLSLQLKLGKEEKQQHYAESMETTQNVYAFVESAMRVD